MRRTRPVGTQVALFVLAGAAALALVGVATSIAARRAGEREAIADVRATTVLRAQGRVVPVLDDALVAGDPQAVARLDAVVRDGVLDRDLVRVKLWAPDGTIVYSDRAELIGSRFALGPGELDAMATGAIEAEVSDLGEPENRYERRYDKLLEVYLPVRTPAGEILLFEAYHRYELVSANADRLWRSFAPVAVGALVMLEVVQVPLAVSLARRLRRRQREREGLLREALTSSERERRRIAGDLHDGVVQDLAGVAYALSAATRRPPEIHTDRRLLEESADAVRASIGALRSLLVDIYPPDLDEVPLASALADLAGRAAEQGLAVHVEADGVATALPGDMARLLYRSAQEALRNVVAHADAEEAWLRVRSDAGSATLEVVDDGRGFADQERVTRRGEGHVGLDTLRGLVRDAGGELTVHSEPGTGTTVLVQVPLR